MQDELQKRIRDRAYEIWENEGRPQGRSDDHWRQAEAEFADARGEVGTTPRKAVKPRAKAAAKSVAAAGKAAAKKARAPATKKTAAKKAETKTDKPA